MPSVAAVEAPEPPTLAAAPVVTTKRELTPPAHVPEPARDGHFTDLESSLLALMRETREDHKHTVEMLGGAIEKNSIALTDLSLRVSRVGYLVVGVFAALLAFTIGIVALTHGVDPTTAAKAAKIVVGG